MAWREKRSAPLLLAALALLALIILVYAPGLHGPFVLDDSENITNNPDVALQEFTVNSLRQALLSNESGPLKRPLAALSFALNYYQASGFENPFVFKLTNLVIHGINCLLVLLLSMLLLRVTSPVTTSWTEDRRLAVAVLATGMWALHPIQLTNVLYVVQRMNSLSATFVLAGLILFVYGRMRFATESAAALRWMLSGVLFGTLLGLSAKENAVLTPLFALVLEYTLFSRVGMDARQRSRLIIFYVAMLLVPLLIVVGYLLWRPGFLAGLYTSRDFTAYERMLTETRVLWLYLRLLFLPALPALGLFHDDIAPSRGFLEPATTLPSAAGIALLLVGACAAAGRWPMLAFAILWFLAGHALESTVVDLEIAYEHRNYLPSFGPLLAVAYGAVVVSTRQHSAAVLALVVIATLAFSTWSRAHTWSSLPRLAETTVRHHPRSPRANDLAATVALQERHDLVEAIGYSLRGHEAAPRETGFLVDLRLRLAILETELNARPLDLSPITAAGPASGGILGLPEAVQLRLEQGELRLGHAAIGDRAITDMLSNGTVSVHGIAALESLGRCLIAHATVCQALLAPGREWLAAAASNPLAPARHRAIALANLGLIDASYERYREAANHMSRAVELMPGFKRYQRLLEDYRVRSAP